MTAACLALAGGCASLPLRDARPADLIEPPASTHLVEDILGATSAEIDGLLGVPALTRREGDGEFRRYTLSQCELIVVLYPNDQGVRRAAHIDTAAKHSGLEKPVLSDCLAAG